MNILLTALVYALVFLIIAVLIIYIIDLLFPLPAKVKTIAGVIVLLIALVWFLKAGGLVNL